MRIIVCGAGMVGFAIARQLASEENDVVVIDQTQQLVDRVMDSLDVQGVVGFASHPDVLVEAGASDADMVIAVTHSDEVNMVACQVCHSLFEVPLKIARIRSAKYLDPAFKDLFSREAIPIDEIISPEREVAETIVSRIQQPGAFDVSDFLDGDIQVAGIHILDHCPVINTPIAQIHELFEELNFVVLALVRDNRLRTCTKTDQLFPGDDIYILYRTQQRERIFSIFGHEEGQARRIVIIGAGNVGLTAAKRLEENNSNLRITVVERDEKTRRNSFRIIK
jgi:K+ transport systems, NAD-binding component